MHRIFSKFSKVQNIDWVHRILGARKTFLRAHRYPPKYLALTQAEEAAFRRHLHEVHDSDDAWFGNVPKEWKPVSRGSRYLGLEIVNFDTPGIDWDRAIDLLGV